jgi:Putative Flp pilus-assembly TadE/G-like
MAAKQSGQTLPLVALMMVGFLGIAALVVDGSNAYSQQRRMQADLDMAVKVAAANLPEISAAQTKATDLLVQRGYTNPGITINVPPQTAPYMQKSCPLSMPQPCYAEGFLTQNVRSFFAGVLGRQSMKISVHAVAETGGNTWQPPQLLALSPTGASNGGCGVLAQGGAGVSGELDASVHSNSQSCVKSGTIFADGEVVSDITTAASNGNPIPSIVNGTSGNGTGTFMPNPYDPGWTVPGTLWLPAINGKTCPKSGSSCTSSCSDKYPYHSIAPGDTYYQPGPTGIAVMSNGFQSSNGNYRFLPYCDDNGNPTFGVYLFKGNFKLSSTSSQNAPVVNVYDSTFVFDYSSGARIDVTGGSLNMDVAAMGGSLDSTSPFSKTFGGIAIWQVSPVPCNNPINSQLGGNATGTIEGIVDLQCTDITVTGNSTNHSWISGALVAWDITVAGSGLGIVTQNRAVAPPLPRGSVLVQ